MTKEETWKKLVELGVTSGEMPDSQWKLGNAYLRSADLRKASLRSVYLLGVDLGYADLREADLIGTDLRNANLVNSNLSNALLVGADLREATLATSNLSGADLRSAKLGRANLSDVNLGGADLNNADLSESDLREARGMDFDFTFIRGAKFSHNSKDKWSTLRRNYTGTRLFFTLILLTIFFIPYIARTMMWVGINHTQGYIVEAQKNFSEHIDKLQIQDDKRKVLLKGLTEKASKYSLCLKGDCKEWKIYEIIIGLDKGLIYWILVVSLLIYNIFRIILTRSVGILVDEESRSGYTPALGTYQPWSHGYLKLMPLHYTVMMFFWISVVSFSFHAWEWLNSPVWLPLK